jgi:hypothetical protein
MGWMVLLVLVVVALLAFLAVRWPGSAAVFLAAMAFLVLGPFVFILHMLSIGLADLEKTERANPFLAASFWLPPLISFIWFVALVTREPRSTISFIKPHVMIRQPVIAVVIGSALAVLFVWRYEMKTDELLTMSLFALVVFLICAWFLPYVLRPMLKLEDRSPNANAAMATLVGLLLSLMIGLAAFKARERAAELHAAFNTLIDAVVIFLIAALSGAGALLAAQKVSGRKGLEIPPHD